MNQVTDSNLCKTLIQPVLTELNLNIDRYGVVILDKGRYEPPYIHVLPGFNIVVYEVDWNPALPPIKISVAMLENRMQFSCWIYNQVIGCELGCLKDTLVKLMLSARAYSNTLYQSLEDVFTWFETNGYIFNLDFHKVDDRYDKPEVGMACNLSNLVLSIDLPVCLPTLQLWKNSEGIWCVSYYDWSRRSPVTMELLNAGSMELLIYKLKVLDQDSEF